MPLEQRDLLQARGVHCRVIGQDNAQLSLGDDDIIVLLHRLKEPTLFTREQGFFKQKLCHAGYKLIWLDTAPEESSMFIRRVLRHTRFKTKTTACGLVARVHHDGVIFSRRNRPESQRIVWEEPT